MISKKNIFQTEIFIQVSDINYGGHVGNDRFLTIAQEARVRFLRSHGWTELNIDHSGCGILVVEAHVKYLQEVFLGQTLIVSLSVGRCSKCSTTLFYELIEKESQRVVGKIQTKVAFFNYSTRKIGKTPEAFLLLAQGFHE